MATQKVNNEWPAGWPLGCFVLMIIFACIIGAMYILYCALVDVALADDTTNQWMPIVEHADQRMLPNYCPYPGPDGCPTFVPGTPVPMPTVPTNTPGPTRTSTTWPPTVVEPKNVLTVEYGAAYATQTALSVMLTETANP